ncbi:MAG: hypothetical protein M0Z57_07005 [Deltaproteobacteria bacterium]|jgi:hypothetical protein|nr:hypothetical protein [Deltaproteobacteria bacterium]
MDKFCKYKLYFIALATGVFITAGILTVNYYEFLKEPVIIINYEYQVSKSLAKKDKNNKIVIYRLQLTKYYLSQKQNWLNLSKQMLLLYPLDKSLELSKKVGVEAYKNVQLDKMFIKQLKTIYGR